MTCPVSVVIPTKDRPDLLGQAVVSALQGLPEGGEVIVVDDHSNHPASRVLAALDDHRVKIFNNTSTPGCAAARNSGVFMAKGKLLIFLDDDDLMHPHYISHICKFHSNDTEYDFGFSATSRIGFETKTAPVGIGGKDAFSGEPLTNLPPRKRLFGLGCGFWIRRELYNSLGGIDESILINEDTEFAIRLLAGDYRGWYVSTPAMFIRQHDSSNHNNLSSITQRAKTKTRMQAFEAIYQKHKSYLDHQPEIRHFVLARLAKYSGRAGRQETARHVFWQSGNRKYILVWLGYLLTGLPRRLFGK